MKRSVHRARVGVAGLFGAGNFGNEATLTAALQRLGEDHDVVVITERAAEVRADRRVPAVALSGVVTGSGPRWRRLVTVIGNRAVVPLRALRTVRNLDAVVVAGSGPWERLGAGPFGLTYELWALALASKVWRRPYLLWNIGVETQDRAVARWFVRRSARWAAYRSFRDVKSLEAMRQMDAARDTDPVVTDLAFGLTVDRTGDHPDTTPPTVVVGVMTYYGVADDPSSNAAVYESYLERSIGLVRELRNRGYAVVLVGGDEYDIQTAVKVRQALADEAVRVESVGTVPGLVELMRPARAVVALRYHTLIMGALAGVPLVGIAYGQKQGSLLTMLGSPDRVRHAESFKADDVANLVEEAITDRAGQQRAEVAVAEAAALLDEEWPDVRAAVAGR